MLVNVMLACTIKLCLSLATEKWIQNKMPVQIDTAILELNQEEVTALAHHKPKVCAVGDHSRHHKPPVCFVGDHVLLESKKE